MIKLQADTQNFNRALVELSTTLGKDLGDQTKREAKMLCLQIAANAPPRPKGAKNGLAGNIPKLRAQAWMKVVRRLVKPAYAMRVLDAVRLGDPGILAGIANTTTRKELFRSGAVNRLIRLAGAGTEKEPANPQKAMDLLKVLFKAKAGGAAPVVYPEMNAQAYQQYYNLVDKMAKVGLGRLSEAERVYLQKRIQTERSRIIKAYKPTIGTMKAGWVQAAIAIPVKAGKKPPNWLLNKKSIGGASTAGSGFTLTCTMRNSKGNALGANQRLDYVGKAIRYRTRKMINNLKGAMKASLAKKYKKLGQPVPAHLKVGTKPDNSIE